MRESSEYPATGADITQHFLYHCLHHPEFVSGNWGLSSDRQLWHVNGETYINGVMVTVDADYMMGYIIECCDRTLGTMSYYAIATYHGFGVKNGFVHISHDFAAYQPVCGTFGNRTEAAAAVNVMVWGVTQIDAMFAAHEEAHC